MPTRSLLRAPLVGALMIGAFVIGAGAADAQAPANPSFNLINRSPTAIKELYFTPAGDANWGRNRLTGGTIAPGASYAARRRADGNCVFDVRVVFADGRIEDRRNLNTCSVDDVTVGAEKASASASATHKAADDPSFRLLNKGKAAVTQAFAVATGIANWGSNLLSGEPLAPQAERAIHLDKQPGCRFDLRVVFEDGRVLERRRADLCRIEDLAVP